MSVEPTSGVVALARMLIRLGAGETVAVARLAEEENVARASAFDIARRLEAAGLARRGPGGLSKGNAATGLGFAAFGLGPLRGVAETLLALLHEQTEARVELVAGAVVLVGFGKASAGWDLDEGLADGAGVERARLRLAWREDSGRGDRERMAAQFERVRGSLAAYLG